MGPTGRLVTIKRSGVDGPHFPLSLSTCLFGRGIECDIRIQLPVVSKQHCKIEIRGQEVILFNFSSSNPTQVNGAAIAGPVHLKHGDVITIVDRSFRYENESHQNGSAASTEFPGQKRKQESLHQVSRSSFSSDPDGKVQDSNDRSKLCEENVSGSPLVHVKHGPKAGTVSDGPEDHTARKTLNAVHSSELPGENDRNAMDPTAGDFKEDSSIPLVSCHGELKTFASICCSENTGNHESPFRKLYESMKEEFDVKSEKGNVLQSGKKSGSQNYCVSANRCSGGSQDGTQVQVSLKSRPRSGRFAPVKADRALEEQGISQTADRRKDEEAPQTAKETRSPSIPSKEMPRTKTLVQHSPHNPSRKRQSQDLPVNLDQRESVGTDNRTFTPRKLLTRNQTPTKVEDADNFGATPEKLFPKKRGSVPPSVDILATEPGTQSHTVLSPLPIQVERKIQSVSVHQPGKAGATAGPASSASPGPSSVDSSNFGNPINKNEGIPLKRRRVSFGGRLKPELFDENLPPNTPLKRGETPRRSLVSHTPPVLKKIIKEYPQPSRKEDSSEVRLAVSAQDQGKASPARNPTETSPAASDARRRSRKASSVSGGSTSPGPTDIPKRGGRKSSILPSKRTSIDRNQHEILQRIYSRRRSGASEANLIVAKSWADVVKLGAKQTQAKMVRHGPQRPLSRRHRRINTPKKPVSDVHSQSSTGHANSPCTIIIGKAQMEKVHVPARPYRMLNNLVFNKTMDFNEDLSGLTEMFKTPAKGKPQATSLCPNTSSSEDFLGKEFQVPNSGENVFLVAQNKPQGPPDHSPASPTLSRPATRVSANIKKTPGSEERPLKAAASANRFQKSAELRNTQILGPGHGDEEENTDAAENTSGQRQRKTPQQGQKPEGVTEERDSSFDTCEKAGKSEDSSEKVVAVRRSRRYSEQKWDPIADLTTLKRKQDTEPEEDLGGIQDLPQSPAHTRELMDVENKTEEKCQKSLRPELVGMPSRMNIQLKTSPQKVDLEEEPSALRKLTRTLGESEPTNADEDIRLFNRTPKQKLDSAENVTGSKRRSRTPKKMVHSLEDLAGLGELFQTPNHTDKPRNDGKTTTVPCRSPLTSPVNTPKSRKRQLTTPPQKADIEEESSALRKPTQTPRKAMLSHGEPGGGDGDIRLFKETPKQKVNLAENVTGSKRRSRTPKKIVLSLEDLAGLRELFQTPEHIQDPVTNHKTTRAPCKSPLADAANTPSGRRQLKTPLQKVDLEQESLTFSKSTQMMGESMSLYREPGGGDGDIRLFNRTPKQEVDSAENVTGSKRRSRTPKKMVHSLEDLAGLRELFQTPNHTDKPRNDGKTTTVPCRSPLTSPVNTPKSRKRQLTTPPQKADIEEESSALRKPTQTPRKAMLSHGEPGGGDGDIRLFKETPKQKVNLAENVTGSKRRLRTPKKIVLSLEDLAGLRELFQTPEHIQDPVTNHKTTRAPCKSPLADAANTPSGRRQLKTPLQKVDLEQESLTFSKSTQMMGESMSLYREPGGGDGDIRLFNRTPKQEVDSAENVTGSKRRSRTPKKTVHSLEDLAGLRELFQTPNHTEKPRTDGKTTTVSCISPLTSPVNTPRSKRRQLKTPLQKVDLEKDLRTPTQTHGESTQTHREPEGGDEGIRILKETPKQKLNLAENVTGSKRRSRRPKKSAQFLEDLAGLRELFQSPEHIQVPLIDVKATRVPCKSPLADPPNIPTSERRQLKTPLQKVDLDEEPSALRKSTQMMGESMPLYREPGGGDGDIRLFNGTPKQEVDSAENVTGSKRRSRTPKKMVHSLEDLAGLRELFQTPNHTEKPRTDGKTTESPHKSPLREPVNTPRSRRHQFETPRHKVDLKEEPSTLRKSTQTPGESIPSHREPGGGDEDIRLFSRTPKQKADSAENVTRSKKRSRTPKRNAQSLEDLAGLRELFQSPEHTQHPVIDDKSTTAPCKSPLADIVNTPSRRQLKTPLQKMDLEEEPSALRKPTQTPGESTYSHREQGGGDEDIRLFKETPKQEVDSAEDVTGSKRRSRISKKNAQSLEDLTGLRELFQSPEHTQDSVIDVKTTKGPRQSPLADPVHTPMSKRRRLKTSLQKVDLEEPSALRKPTPTPDESACSHREAGVGDKDIKLSEETPKKKLNHVEHGSRSKKWIRTGKEKAQLLEDMVGFKELFQTPEHTKEPTAIVETAMMSYGRPLAEPVHTPTHTRSLKIPLGRVDLEGPIQMPGEATHTPREPGGGDEGIRLFKETPKQKLNPAENVSGGKRQSRRPKKNAQSLEDLVGLRELFQSPEHTQGPVTDDKTSAGPCKSPLADLVHKPMSRRRRPKTSPQKVDLKEEPSALRKSTRTQGGKAHSRGAPGGTEEDIKLLTKTAKQKVDSAENVTRSKKRSRTPKRNAQSLEDLAGLTEPLQSPEHTQPPVTDVKAADVPCKPPLADPIHKPTGRRRQLKTLPQQADAEREPSALRTSTRRRGGSALAPGEPAVGEEDIRLLNKTARQTASSAEDGMLRKSRLRAPKEKAQRLEDLARFEEPCPVPDHSEEEGKDTGGVQEAPVQTPDRRKPANVLQRGLRARRVRALEDPESHAESADSGRKGSISLPSKRKRGAEEDSTGSKRLRSATPAQVTAEVKPPQKRSRAAPSEGWDPPEALTVKKRLRVLAGRMEVPGDLPRGSKETKARGREAAGTAPAQQGRSLRSRRPNTTETEEQRPEPVTTAAVKSKSKTSDKKPPKTSQEAPSQSPDDGAKKSASADKTRESRMCLRSARLTKIPSPDVAEGKQREKRVGVHRKKQEEEVRQPSEPMPLRSRKITVHPGGKALESEPQQRVTRNARTCAENTTKDNDNVCIKKLRTRSRRDNKAI